ATQCNSRYIERRHFILRKCFAYFLQHGIAGLSLRPLGRGVGTSPRMLLHYFGSKDSLIAAVMQQAEAELQSIFQSLLTHPQAGRKKNVMLTFWNTLSNKRTRPIIRLLFEIQILALQN